MSGGKEQRPGGEVACRRAAPPGWLAGNQQGFTVIEVVVAVIILALAYTTILQNFSLSLRNIERVDKKRTSLFEQQLQFEEQLQEAASAEEQEPVGEVFLEGARYQVVIVRNESGELVTLLTEEKQ